MELLTSRKKQNKYLSSIREIISLLFPYLGRQFSIFSFLQANCSLKLVSVHVKSLQSCPTLCDPVDCSLPGFSIHGILQQEYWSGLPCPPPGDLPDLGIKPDPGSLMSPSLASTFFIPSATWKFPQLNLIF